VLQAGAERLAATLDACRRYLPRMRAGRAPRRNERVGAAARALDAGELCRGRGRKVWPTCPAGTLRYPPRAGSVAAEFAGLTPDQIRSGLSVLGRIVAGEIERASGNFEPAGDGVRRKPCLNFSSEQFRLKSACGNAQGRRHHGRHQADQAKIAKTPGLCRDGARARAGRHPQGRRRRPMANIGKIEEIMRTVDIPVMAKARIGHFMEARILEAWA